MSGFTGKINNALDYLTDSILVKRRINKEMMDPKRKAIWGQIELSDEQK